MKAYLPKDKQFLYTKNGKQSEAFTYKMLKTLSILLYSGYSIINQVPPYTYNVFQMDGNILESAGYTVS